MNSKAIARIVPINDDGDGRLPFYARTVIETIGGFEGVEIDGSEYACNKAWWKIEMLPSEWNGEGLPPVGTECELRHHSKDEWHTVKITGFGEEGVVLRMPNVSNELYLRVDGRQFRPIRSERDKAIEALSLVILESHADDDEDMNTETYIYDSIAAGKIPGIKLKN